MGLGRIDHQLCALFLYLVDAFHGAVDGDSALRYVYVTPFQAAYLPDAQPRGEADVNA